MVPDDQIERSLSPSPCIALAGATRFSPCTPSMPLASCELAQRPTGQPRAIPTCIRSAACTYESTLAN